MSLHDPWPESSARGRCLAPETGSLPANCDGKNRRPRFAGPDHAAAAPERPRASDLPLRAGCAAAGCSAAPPAAQRGLLGRLCFVADWPREQDSLGCPFRKSGRGLRRTRGMSSSGFRVQCKCKALPLDLADGTLRAKFRGGTRPAAWRLRTGPFLSALISASGHIL